MHATDLPVHSRVGEIRDWLCAGKTVDEIAGILGLTRWVVLHRIRKHSLAMPPKRGRPIDEDRHREVMRLLQETDLSHREIARRVGCSQHAVSYRGRKLAQRRARQVDAVGAFRPREQERRCPVHGAVKLWPCVACMAEASRQQTYEIGVARASTTQ